MRRAAETRSWLGIEKRRIRCVKFHRVIRVCAIGIGPQWNRCWNVITYYCARYAVLIDSAWAEVDMQDWKVAAAPTFPWNYNISIPCDFSVVYSTSLFSHTLSFSRANLPRSLPFATTGFRVKIGKTHLRRLFSLRSHCCLSYRCRLFALCMPACFVADLNMADGWNRKTSHVK